MGQQTFSQITYILYVLNMYSHHHCQSQDEPIIHTEENMTLGNG